MPDLDLIAVLERLIQAFPDKRISQSSLQVYVDELADIPPMLLERAVRRHIRTSAFFPRVSELRQAAEQIISKYPYIPGLSPHESYLTLEAHLLEDDYFHHAEFNLAKWEKLAELLDQADRPHQAKEVRQNAQHIREREAAFQRGEEYPSAQALQRYARWGTQE